MGFFLAEVFLAREKPWKADLDEIKGGSVSGPP